MNLNELTAGHATPRTAAQLREQAQADYRAMVAMTLDAPHGRLVTLDTPAAEIDRREAAAHRLGQYIGVVLAAETYEGTHNPRQLGQTLADLLAAIADEAYLELEYAAHAPAEQPAALRVSA